MISQTVSTHLQEKTMSKETWPEVKRQCFLEIDMEGTLSAEVMRQSAAQRFKSVVRSMAYTNWPIIAPAEYTEPLFVYIVEISKYGEAGVTTVQNTMAAMEYITGILCSIYTDTNKKKLFLDAASIHLKEQFPLLKIEHYTVPDITP